MKSHERWRRREEIKNTIRRAILERVGELLPASEARAKMLSSAFDDTAATTIFEALMRDYQIREKPRGSRVVPP